MFYPINKYLLQKKKKKKKRYLKKNPKKNEIRKKSEKKSKNPKKKTFWKNKKIQKNLGKNPKMNKISCVWFDVYDFVFVSDGHDRLYSHKCSFVSNKAPITVRFLLRRTFWYKNGKLIIINKHDDNVTFVPPVWRTDIIRVLWTRCYTYRE